VHATTLALLAFAVLVGCIAAVAAADEEPTGGYLAKPLDVEILFPADGAAFRDGNITAVVEADGESVAYFSDAFTNGTLVNATVDPSGVVANGSAPGVESYYRSPEFELPRVAPAIEWLGSLEFTTSGTNGNLTELFLIQVRFGDLTAGRNWSAWFNATADGDFEEALGNASDALRGFGALQYQFTFLQPTNTSNPHVSGMEIWFIGHIERFEWRLASASVWTLVAADEGRYNVSVALPEGNSTIEARVLDALGGTRTVRVNVTRDNSPPVVASAPQNGASIPPDESAQIRFDGPMDPATAAAGIEVHADFAVDQVWTADNTTLLLSAQESGKRGLVTVTINSALKDKAGNAFAGNATYTYEMGKLPDAQPSITPLVIAVFGIVGLAAIGVLVMSQRSKKQREEHADKVRRQMDGEEALPPKSR
jgi:hypothetical protein